MNIHYDLKRKIWFQSIDEQDHFLGKSTLPLAFLQKDHEKFISFQMKTQENHLGPLIGIMTSRTNNQQIAGNAVFFKSLQKNIVDKGGLAVVFAEEDLFNDYLVGYMYIEKMEKWLKAVTPLPDVVYNRVPFRRREHSSSFNRAIQLLQQKEIPYFNPSFLDKYSCYTLLKKDPLLKNFCPETILVEEDSLLSFLLKHRKIYLKPTNSAKGKGIFRLQLYSDGTLIMEGLKSTTSYSHFEKFWKDMEPIFRLKQYVAQIEITPLLYNGKRFDFRILAHFNEGKYVLTGVGVRQSSAQTITTHIPNGGKLLSYKDFQNDIHDQMFQKVVEHCGSILANAFGFYGEFSIDLGLTDEGNYVLYEINSKPMSFDEKEIETKKIRNLTDLFFQLSSFT